MVKFIRDIREEIAVRRRRLVNEDRAEKPCRLPALNQRFKCLSFFIFIMTGLPPKVEALHDRIKGSEVLPQDDKDALLQFSNELGVHNYSRGRRVKLLQHCTMMAGDSEKYDPDQLPDPDLVDILGETEKAKEKAKQYVSWINGNYDSEESKRDH